MAACHSLLLVATIIIAASLVAVGIHYVCFDRTNLPDLQAFGRFDFSHCRTTSTMLTVGLSFEMASECRQITRYKDIPPIVRDAIIAAEDKKLLLT